MIDENGLKYQECIVGNIVGLHYWGADKQLRKGTKYFSAGTKLYCVFMYDGMGHQRVRVMGKSRGGFRMIDSIIKIDYIENFRVQKVYRPGILQFIKNYTSGCSTEMIGICKRTGSPLPGEA